MYKTIFVNMLDCVENLFEVLEVEISVDFPTFRVKHIMKCVSRAILHLYHHVNRLKLLILFNELK